METIFERAFVAKFTNPLQQLWAIIPVQQCTFPHGGAYLASLNVGGVTIANRRLSILLEGEVS
jgi:hypothetical protein